MSAQGLPAHILALFTPRPPPQHLPPLVERKPLKLTGCAEFVEYFSTEENPPREPWESPLERKARRHREKIEANLEEQRELRLKYDPHKDPNVCGDPFKTLFVARISYDTTEKKLKREFEVFGSIKRVRMVYDQKGKPRGYCFIEYEHERDLKNAYKQGDGKKIDGRRVMVDVERGRTVEGWFPRRLGGGRGPGRVGKTKNKKKLAALAAREKEKEKESTRHGSDRAGGDRDRDRDRDRADKKDKVKEKDREKDGKEKEKERDRKDDKGKEKDKIKEKEKDRGDKDGRKRDRSRSRRDRSGSRGGDRKKSRRD